MKIPVVHIEIDEYMFNKDINPYAFDLPGRKSLSDIAERIAEAIVSISGTTNVLIRGIQSGYHEKIGSQDQVVERVLARGSDTFENRGESDVLYAAPFSGVEMVDTVLSGFHMYKPKCEERPQYPVDIWMVYSGDAYENVEYMHPVHHVVAKDKWRMKSPDVSGLIGIITIN